MHLKGLYFSLNKLWLIKAIPTLLKFMALFLDSYNLSCAKAVCVLVEGNKKSMKIYT